MNFSWLTNLNRLIVRRRTRLFWALTSVIIASLAILVIYPALREIKTTAAEIIKLKDQLKQRQAPEYALKDILASYRQHEVKLGSLNRAVMNKSRELEFITALEDIAARYGLQQKIVIGNYQALPNNAFSQMPLQLQLTGNFKDELRYLQGLERLPFYVNVKQISLNSIAAPPIPSNADAVAATAENLVNLVITADTFWQ
ncbi:hypothetical protein A3G56_00345 [Candidatus Falkowbacteria bacterium RIFCSPLOWO2_12_FULL_45_10]|uniref:Uncharacterized protein n=1 Tax=Candidatus Falkowbacteria bacterium RIFCSPLOWO2_12_FULL_45_10 TaxID=1797990 RepID=A0A1F5RZ87_9BACT|nr:MAG: hypothetical protein A3G56_00345 [Candidatus Falkowbacteria bacterium RIFCSPLOWO2_12_FULL_45_10]